MLPSLMSTRGYLPSFVDDFFGNDLLSNFFDFQTGVSTPAVNIVESKEDFKIEVAAPGLNKEDFKIDVHNNVMTISSEKEEKREEKEEKYMRREFSYTSFKRSFSLPSTVNVENIKASHKEGILTISLPKKEEAKEKPARQINIS
jgi:HSP20 family protein